MKRLNIFMSIVFISMTFFATAQISTPKPSPLAKTSQAFGLNEVTVEYSRPGVKERVIFGELVPYNELWRTGANAATKITFEDDVKINGNDLAAGEYSLFTVPAENVWKVYFNRDANASTGTFNAADNALEIDVKPSSTCEKVERFAISFNDITDESLVTRLSWDKTKVEFKVETEVEALVMDAIKTAMAGVSSRTYYDAAMYYYNNDKDLKQALEWVNKAVAMEEEPKFWMLHNKAKIQAATGDYKGAIKTANQSLDLAKAAEYGHYIHLNEQAIKEWSAKK
ncbi:MAG: DUF2911 domain-containing protein [Chitinophagales bacterium]